MASKLPGVACRGSAAIWVPFGLISVGGSTHSALQENIASGKGTVLFFLRTYKWENGMFTDQHDLL
jgi:hypothetical protein